MHRFNDCNFPHTLFRRCERSCRYYGAVQFDYDNGFGSRAGRFRIDLYASGGSGDCGTFITSICDKPDKGCHDTRKL